MKTIWKFSLQPTVEHTILMPVGAEILSVQTQRNTACIWALVDPTAEKEKRKFIIVGTGTGTEDCDWGDVRNIITLHRMQVLRNSIYKHIKRTGHKITLETGNSTVYSLEE